jgi:hypothetical protein
MQKQEIPEEEKPLQTKKENNTGMPDNLKAGVENLSGIDMSDVRVHYYSTKPTGVGALAYTQGTDIHVAPGQEQHLPHEAWHVVQQVQGRVRPTMQLKDVAVNDDVGLETEADVMGSKALIIKEYTEGTSERIKKHGEITTTHPIQRLVRYANVDYEISIASDVISELFPPTASLPSDVSELNIVEAREMISLLCGSKDIINIGADRTSALRWIYKVLKGEIGITSIGHSGRDTFLPLTLEADRVRSQVGGQEFQTVDIGGTKITTGNACPQFGTKSAITLG